MDKRYLKSLRGAFRFVEWGQAGPFGIDGALAISLFAGQVRWWH